MEYDPYTGKQMKFSRRDKSGRWSPIKELTPYPCGLAFLGGAAAGILFALML